MPDESYEHLIIKDYNHWTLFLHKVQYPYIGRSYAWWRDTFYGEGQGLKPTDIPEAAAAELKGIFGDAILGCHALGHPTEPYGQNFLLNMCYLSNELAHNHHLHWHFIPRFSEPILLRDIDVQARDYRWGSNYARAALDMRELEAPKLEYIRARMAETLA